MEAISPLPLTHGDTKSRWRVWVVLALVALSIAVVLAFRVGFQGSDDNDYLLGALGWLESFPYVGTNHWRLRHTITVPTALFIHLLGLREWVVSLSNISYYFAFLGINGWFASRFLGGRATALATLLMAIAPGLPVVGTYLSPDIPELFYMSTAFWLLMLARAEPQRAAPWLLCGALAGLGFVNRQTAAAFPMFVMLACWLSPGAARRRYGLVALAFLGVIAAEWLYLTVMTGQPLYRSHIDFNHGVVDRFAEFASVKAQGRWIDNEGNLAVNVFIDPFLTLFVSQKYTLLFWLAVPAAVVAWKRRSSTAGHTLMLMLGLGAVSFAFVAANPKLLLVPRYFVVPAWVAAMLAGWGLALAWDSGWRKLSLAGVTAAVLASAVGLGVENVDPRVVERGLVRWATAHPGQTVHTDIVTHNKAGFYFIFAGLDRNQVSTSRPQPGDLFYGCEHCVPRCNAAASCRGRAADFQPQPGWTVVERIDGPRKPVAKLADLLGLDRLLPRDIAQRFMAPTARMVIYRVQ